MKWYGTLLLLLGWFASVRASGLESCVDCECRPPRNPQASLWETFTEVDPNNPATTRTCVCNCGKEELEGCVRGECAFGLRCLHSKHTEVNDGNICKPLCKDPGVYRPAMHTKCVEDTETDTAIVIPRTFTCIDDDDMTVEAVRILIDGHMDTRTFINPCHMTNANAELLGNEAGSLWEIGSY